MEDAKRAWIIDAATSQTFQMDALDDDPWYRVVEVAPGSPADQALRRGSSIRIGGDATSREIVGVSVVSSPLGSYYDLLAPERISPTAEAHKYVRLRSAGGDGPFPLRPGSSIIGGRRSGFYDLEGIILSAQYIGGSRDRFEDWVYLVISDEGTHANWVPLYDINVPVAGPERVYTFRGDDDRKKEGEVIDFLIRSGERELIDYLSVNESKLGSLNPRQFEASTQSIYRGLGFDVEPMGNWNQQDGGVDFIAVSKSVSGHEIRTAVQCKASRNKISARPIRELAGVMPRFGAQQGVVVTTSTFTEPARQERDDWFASIELADRRALYDKIVQLMGSWGVDTTQEDEPMIGFTLGPVR